MEINKPNFEIIREGILCCCEDIKNNIDNIMKNYKRAKCTGGSIVINLEPMCVPSYTEHYEYVSEEFINKELNKNKGEN